MYSSVEFADCYLFIGLLPFADSFGFYRRDVTQNVTRCGVYSDPVVEAHVEVLC
jgi:hypothetical protein